LGPKSKPGEGVYRYEGASKSLVYVNQYFEKNLSTSEVTTHYYLGGKEIAFRKGSTLEYLHTDHLGSTSVTTNTSGPQVSKVAYFPFGGTRYQNGDLGFDKMFTGQRLDRTGLYYYNARYYDAAMGRFISPDTIVPNPTDPQSLNRYSYCRNNPLFYIDPTGHDWKDWFNPVVDGVEWVADKTNEYVLQPAVDDIVDAANVVRATGNIIWNHDTASVDNLLCTGTRALLPYEAEKFIETHDLTLGLGVMGSVSSLGPGAQGSLLFAIDLNQGGNDHSAFIASWGTGGISNGPGVTGAVFLQVTNAPSLNNLAYDHANITGLGLGQIPAAGGEVITGDYYGGNIFLGVSPGLPLPGEFYHYPNVHSSILWTGEPTLASVAKSSAYSNWTISDTLYYTSHDPANMGALF